MVPGPPANWPQRGYAAISCLFCQGPGGLLQFLVQPFLACRRQYPAGTACGLSQLSADDIAFANQREARLPGCVFTRPAQRSIPAARKIASQANPGFVGRLRTLLSRQARLLSFVVLTPSTSGLSPAGLHQLSLDTPLTTTVYTRLSDEELRQRVRGLAL